MTYIENTYICLAAPLILAILCLRNDWRRALTFLLAGMTCCMLSAYVSTYLATVFNTEMETATHAIAPAVEEAIKFLPIMFYSLVFRPGKKNSANGIMLVAVGFATFENVCYLTANGSAELLKLIIRGFGTGAMHVVCGTMLSVGMIMLWEKNWLRVIGTFAVLCSAITFHAIFNIVVSAQGMSLWIASIVPITLILIYRLFLRKKLKDHYSY